MGAIAYTINDASGTTANSTVSISPPIGYRWTVKLLMAKINTGSTSSTRALLAHLSMGKLAFNSDVGYAIFLNMSFSTVSSSQTEAMAPISTGANTENYPDFDISSADAIEIAGSGFVAGDSLYLYLLVDEQPER